MTKTIIKIGIGAAIVAAAVAVFPALRGPYNRAKNAANEKLNDEFVVDNYKAEYVNLHDKRVQVVEAISKFKVEQAVASKKLDYVNKEVEAAKKILVATSTSDFKAFQRAKDAYEVACSRKDNFNVMMNTYSNALAKLNASLELIDMNMMKAKTNVDTLQAKKTMLDAIKNANKTVENMNGIGDSSLGISLEKLDDDTLRESIKLEALSENATPNIASEAEAKAYLESIK